MCGWSQNGWGVVSVGASWVAAGVGVLYLKPNGLEAILGLWTLLPKTVWVVHTIDDRFITVGNKFVLKFMWFECRLGWAQGLWLN